MGERLRRSVCWLVISLAGCVSSEPSRAGSSWQSLRVDTESGPDRILFDVAFVQRPLDDPFLNRDLWLSADEMILSADLREQLELNGFRIGILVGSPPEKLAQLLQSDRSCVDRKGRSTPSGANLEQKLRESSEDVELKIHAGRTADAHVLHRPLFAFDILPRAKRQSVRMKMTPRIESGEKAMNFKPVPEESKWTLEMARPTVRLENLAMELDLAADQILLIGCRPEREGTIGYHAFVAEDSGEPMQRLLILRHLRPKSPPPTATEDVPDAALASTIR